MSVDIEFDFKTRPTIDVSRSGAGWLMIKIDETEVHFWCHSGEEEHQLMLDLIRALENKLNVVDDRRKKPKKPRREDDE